MPPYDSFNARMATSNCGSASPVLGIGFPRRAGAGPGRAGFYNSTSGRTPLL